MRSRAAFLALAGAIAIVIVALLFAGSPITFDADKIAAEVRASGPLGSLALIGFLIVQAVIAPLPSPPLLVAAGYVYGPFVGFVIGWVGLLLGASACFGLARLLGRPFAERFVRPDRLAVVDRSIGSQSGPAFLTLVSLRVLVPPAFDAVSYGCGLVQLPFLWFALATAIGEVPKVASDLHLPGRRGR